MPFTFAQPINLKDGLPPLPSIPREGPKAPPLHTPRPAYVAPPGSASNRYVARVCYKQWTVEEATDLIKSLIKATENKANIPDTNTLISVVDTVFREQPSGSFYDMLKASGLPVWREVIPEVIESMLYTANRYGQNFPLKGVDHDAFKKEGFQP